MTVVNLFGLQSGKLVQNIVTCCKGGGIALLVIMLLSAGGTAKASSAQAPVAGPPMILGIGAALVAVLWAYEGWHVVSFTAAEFRNPRRDLPRSLSWGALALAGIYLVANISYYHVLSPAQLQATDRAAATAVGAAYGGPATNLVTCLIVVSILGSINGMTLTGPRVYFAMARDGLFFRSFGRLSAGSQAPNVAIVVQGIWSMILALAGSFQQLFTYVVFTAWIFYGIAVFAVIVLRRREANLDRPYRVPAYPFVPILFVAAAGFIVAITIANEPMQALYGIGLILTGLPLYWFAFHVKEASGSAAETSVEQ